MKARASEDKGEGMPSAPSSRPVSGQESLPRIRGGVPIATNSGASVENVKRKAGVSVQADAKRKDGEVGQEAEQDMRDKKSKTGKEEERGAKRSIDDWE